MIDPTDLHPACRALFDYWRSIHPPAGLPGRRHFNPSAITALLPTIHLVEVHRSPLRFRYRLLGSQVDVMHGRPLVGRWLDEAFADHPNGRQLVDDYREVAERAAPSWRRGAPRIGLNPDCAALEVLRLPLAADGETVDMILCVSVYFDGKGRPLEERHRRTLGY